jgi:hypothetical protein
MNNKTNNQVLFNYIEETQSRPSLKKKIIVAGFVWALIMIIFNVLMHLEGLTLAYVIKKSLIFLAAGAAWAIMMYIAFKWFEKRLMTNKSQDFTFSVPESTGKMISKISCNHSHRGWQSGGILFIGNNGFAFIPHKYNWGSKAKSFDFQWNDVGTIYKSTGSFSFRHIYNGALGDRLAIEINDKSYFFVINQHLDRVIDDLNNLLDSHSSL